MFKDLHACLRSDSERLCGFVSTMSVLFSFEVCAMNTSHKPIGLSVARPKPCDRELKIIQISKGGSIDKWNQKEKARTANETEHLNDGPKDVREWFISTVHGTYVKRRKTVLLPIKKEHE